MIISFGKIARAVDNWDGQASQIFGKRPLYILFLWLTILYEDRSLDRSRFGKAGESHLEGHDKTTEKKGVIDLAWIRKSHHGTWSQGFVFAGIWPILEGSDHA